MVIEKKVIDGITKKGLKDYVLIEIKANGELSLSHDLSDNHKLLSTLKEACSFIQDYFDYGGN